MDLSLFFAVLWRSKWLVLGGAVLGAVLAVLVYGSPSLAGGKPTLTPRSAQVWQSESQLLISQADFPYRESPEAYSPEQQMGSLSPVYANLANGNIVQAQIHRQLGSVGTVKASEDVDLAASSFLPFVNITATAPTESGAIRLAQGAASIFVAYVTRQQTSARIPADRRIRLAIVQSGGQAKLVEGHKLSIPLLVFVAVLIGVIAVVFLKENLQPRVATELDRLPAKRPSRDRRADATREPLHEHVTASGGDTGVHRDPVVTSHAQQW
jgi:capsular polysaccharide biosynthesis protein